MRRLTRRERLKSALYLSKVSKICAGRIYEKLRKLFRDPQRVPFMLDKIQKPLFRQLGTKTRRERLNSTLYLRLKKHETFFWKKLDFSFEKCRSAEKCKRGTLLDLLTYILLQNIKKLEEGPFGHIKKNSKQVAQRRKKTKGDPLGTSGFVGFLEKVKK